MLRMQVITKIPKGGTYIRAFLDAWVEVGQIKFTHAMGLYGSGRGPGRSLSRTSLGLTMTRYLKRFGQRARDPHTGRSLGWTVRPAVKSALEEGRMTAVEDVDVVAVP